MILRCLLVFPLFFFSAAHAAPIELFSTGVDDLGHTLSLGQLDPHYTVVSSGNQAVKSQKYNGSGANNWVPDTSTSGWIWVNQNGTPAGNHTFRTTFDLSGFDPLTAIIEGTMAVDNAVTIFLNGVSTGYSLPVSVSSYNSRHSFSISSGFISGLNTLDFVTFDNGFIGGLQVDLTLAQAEAVPEPSIIALMGLGLAGIVVLRRKKLSA